MVRAALVTSLHFVLLLMRLEAGIIASTGMVQFWRNPPATVEVHQLERNRVVIVFEERTRLLPVPIESDIAVPGRFETVYPMHPGIIPDGISVTSYYFHADPRGRVSGNLVRYVGSVTFDSTILGVLVKPRTLHPTDHLLGLPTVRYPRESDPRQGVLGPGDYITLSGDMRTVRFDLRAGLWSDDFRVIVAHDDSPTDEPPCHRLVLVDEGFVPTICPEPTTFLLMITALSIAGWRWRSASRPRRSHAPRLPGFVLTPGPCRRWLVPGPCFSAPILGWFRAAPWSAGR